MVENAHTQKGTNDVEDEALQKKGRRIFQIEQFVSERKKEIYTKNQTSLSVLGF